MRQSMVADNRDGMSLIEILVSVTLLSVVLMSLSGAAALGLSQMSKAKQDLQYSADVQQVTDSLMAASSINRYTKVASGSTTIRGRAISWTATDVNVKSQVVSIIVPRRGQMNTAVMYADTVTIYLANRDVQ
jgi:prepilin-type N-terminal cleavage/methylation domain-containing protein